MNTILYTFSGSGNSLLAAKKLAAGLNGKVLSIPGQMHLEKVEPDADVIGLIFPAYYANMGGSGLPLIVSRFIKKLHNLQSKYIFAVCTHSGDPYITIENVQKLISEQGGKLNAGFTLRMGLPYPPLEKLKLALFHQKLSIDTDVETRLRREILDDCTRKIDFIIGCVSVRKSGTFETLSPLKKKLSAPFMSLQFAMGIKHSQQMAHSNDPDLEHLIPFEDRSFLSSEACKGCGTCVKACPVQNIVLIDGHPVWQHHCETCFACFQWCPNDAIRGELIAYEKKFHYPEIRLRDFLMEESKKV